ncbi:MAG: 3-deoxy-manno-octulosonate cytidylyltransferase [Planctomycetota bacterium]|jgi:3-deoxy-manno-octulosonate cytidylyltransferase (CMP-KDO synthetase)
MSNVLAVIPARLASSRLPRKVLLDRTGKPLIQHVWEGAKACNAIDKIVIATDAEEVVESVKKFGAEAVLTSDQCQSGTDRVAEAAAKVGGADIVVNVQGDEPEMSAAPLYALIEGMKANPDLPMGTVSVPWPKGVSLDEPGFVKVVTDVNSRALYFSRSAVPFIREDANAVPYRKHVGLYAYKPDFLAKFATLAPTPLERAESLEQLRALEYGYAIGVFETEYEGYEVNTPEDYEEFVKRVGN